MATTLIEKVNDITLFRLRYGTLALYPDGHSSFVVYTVASFEQTKKDIHAKSKDPVRNC